MADKMSDFSHPLSSDRSTLVLALVATWTAGTNAH